MDEIKYYPSFPRKQFLYFQRQKINQYFRCPVDCPYKEEEIFVYCGEKGFCDYLNQQFSNIKTDKENIFKYR